jgi:hypothetical protein
MPQTWDPMVQNYEAFNKERGALHGMAAFQQIDRRGPELLAQAGWSRREWLDFRSWLFLDEAAYPIEKLRRLRESGGRPYKLGDAATLTRRVIVSSYKGANHSIRFFAFVIAASLLVAAIAARRFLFVFGCLTAWLGYLYVLITWMLAHQRFPNRVSMPFYIATALAVASLVVAHLDDRPRALRAGRRLASLALALLVVVTGYHWVRDLGRFDPRADVEVQLAAFTSRLADRYDRGAVIVKDARVRLLYDPLAPPLPYEVVPLGWGTFSVPFYREINRLGISRGSELVPALVDNPNAYILIHRRRLRTVQGYIRRQVPHAQLEWVDAPETRRPFALYRVVSEADEGSERSPP